MVFDGVEGRALFRPVLPHQSQLKMSVWTSLCARGHCHAETGKGLCCHKVGSTESSRMSLFAVVLIFTFTGTKGLSPNHEKSNQIIFGTSAEYNR